MANYHQLYLRNQFNPTMARAVVETFGLRASRPDLLVGTGLSGTINTVRLSDAYGIPFAIVRRFTDRPHSFRLVEGVVPDNGGRWIFVDDLICSGMTLRKVHAVMCWFAERRKLPLTFAGVYQMNPGRYTDASAVKRDLGVTLDNWRDTLVPYAESLEERWNET